jgi:hypothetical protein
MKNQRNGCSIGPRIKTIARGLEYLHVVEMAFTDLSFYYRSSAEIETKF